MKRLLTLLASVLLSAAPVHADAPAVKRLEIHPSDRILHAPGATQQLAVIAHFSDGSYRDVTHLTAFSSTDEEVAEVSQVGKVRFHKTGEAAIRCRYQITAMTRLTYVAAKEGYAWPKPPVANLIDHLVFTKLKQLQIPPSDLCEDHIFVRRVYLDICGILPRPEEVRRFMDDRHPLKRSRLIDQLIERPEFGEYWAQFWTDTLNIKWSLDRPSGARVLAWFRDRIYDNTPMDRITRDLILGKEIITRQGPMTYYTGMDTAYDWSERTGQAFLGMRLACAQCHPHSDANWTREHRDEFAALFAHLTVRRYAGWKRSIEVFATDTARELKHPETNLPIVPRFPDGSKVVLKPGQDRREALADWLTAPDNPYFARTMVNRIWQRLTGKGLVEFAESLHEQPFTSNDALLDALAKSFVAERFDLKAMVRIITNSRTYQLSSTTTPHNAEDTKYFSHAYPKRLINEVFEDAFAQVVEMPLDIEDMPVGTRSVQVMETDLRVFFFPRNNRIAVCEADTRGPDLRSTIHYLNSQEVGKMITSPKNRVGRLIFADKSDREIMEEIFMATFARPAKQAEWEQYWKHSRRMERQTALQDVLWAVVNTKEFALRQ